MRASGNQQGAENLPDCHSSHMSSKHSFFFIFFSFHWLGASGAGDRNGSSLFNSEISKIPRLINSKYLAKHTVHVWVPVTFMSMNCHKDDPLAECMKMVQAALPDCQTTHLSEALRKVKQRPEARLWLLTICCWPLTLGLQKYSSQGQAAREQSSQQLRPELVRKGKLVSRHPSRGLGTVSLKFASSFNTTFV